ncbi:MAG: N-acetyltransferase [candidate division WOR-3 bacterium]
MGILIKEIDPYNNKELKNFVLLEWEIYKGDPNWVPPIIDEDIKRLSPKTNPVFRHMEAKYYMAFKDGKPVGRIDAHIDWKYNEIHDENAGFFGFFECINDREVAHLLFEHAIDWLKSKGAETVYGPMNFNTNDDECGLLIQGFDSPPVVGMTYNPPYYIDLIESYGFQKAKDLVAHIIVLDDDFMNFVTRLEARLQPLSEKAQSYGFTIRNVNLKKLDEEIKIIFDIYNDAWEQNWGSLPFEEEEIKHLANGLKQIVIPELAKIVEYNGVPAAFGLVLPDINQILKELNGRLFPLGFIKFLTGIRKVNGLRLLALGIKKGYRRKGADSLLYYHLLKDALKMKRFKYCEVSWLLEDNYLIIRATEFMRGKHYKTYRVYRKFI